MPRLLLCALLVLWAVQVLAQDREPVVLVWGEHLAAANAKEAPGTRSYMENIARALDAVGIKYATTKDSELPGGVLEGRRFAIFPYNSGLTDEEHAAIRKFVAEGGKLWASFTQDPVLNELLGVSIAGGVGPEKAGGYAGMLFTETAPPGMPVVVANGSWNSHRIQPAEGTQVIATWTDVDDADTGIPALTLNANGCYHGHVMLGGDVSGKGRMFLGLIGHFFPEMWQAAVAEALPKMTQLHGYDSPEAVQDALEAAEKAGRDVFVASDRLKRASDLRARARELFEDGEYPQALQAAEEAHEALRSATYPLAASREGELRAVWMSGRSNDWDEQMKALADAGFNAVFPNFCSAGGAQYESDVLPPVAGYSGNQLAACLEAAEKYDIEVHPWRINWRLSGATPERIAQFRADDRLAKPLTGEGGEWLCPSDERNRKLEVDAMVEMARSYAVTGIHFDYIRYDGPSYCYCDKCRANFQRDAEVEVANWPTDVLKEGPHYARFQDWRREQITRVVREVYRRAHEIRPEIVVSAAVFSNWPSSRVSIGQDAAAWAEEGIIDLLMPMTYTNSNDSLAKLTDQHVALTRGRALLAEGIGAFSSHSQFTGPDQLIQQIETSRRHGADGFCIFSYTASVQKDFLPALAEGCTGERTYTIPVLRPRVVFSLNDDPEGEWFADPEETIKLSADVSMPKDAQGPRAPTAATFRWVLQGIDGRSLPAGAAGSGTIGGDGASSFASSVKPAPGGYRMAIEGEMTLTDGTRQPFICRSRPFVILDEAAAALRRGELPAPEAVGDRPRVGVLSSGYGAGGILQTLQSVEGIGVEPVDRVTPEVARSCNLLIITQDRSGAGDELVAGALRGWIQAGGAVLTTHDAVGYRSHPAIVPDIAIGVDHLKSDRVRVTKPDLMPPGLDEGLLEHGFYDHVILKPGEGGRTVVTDEEGRPVVVIGRLGKGRYAASGIAFGLNADTRDALPGEAERALLVKLVEWLLGEG